MSVDFDLTKRAGLTDIDLAGLLGVSKAAVNQWRTGKIQPHALRLPKIKKLMDLISVAVESKALPVAPITSVPERLDAIKAVLRQYVNS